MLSGYSLECVVCNAYNMNSLNNNTRKTKMPPSIKHSRVMLYNSSLEIYVNQRIFLSLFIGVIHIIVCMRLIKSTIFPIRTGGGGKKYLIMCECTM